jgi:hypothetical protein
VGGTGRVADLEQRHGADVDETALDSIGPLFGVRADAQAHYRRLVDEPRGATHDQTPRMTSSSCRSGKPCEQPHQVGGRHRGGGATRLLLQLTAQEFSSRDPETGSMLSSSGRSSTGKLRIKRRAQQPRRYHCECRQLPGNTDALPRLQQEINLRLGIAHCDNSPYDQLMRYLTGVRSTEIPQTAALAELDFDDHPSLYPVHTEGASISWC